MARRAVRLLERRGAPGSGNGRNSDFPGESRRKARSGGQVIGRKQDFPLLAKNPQLHYLDSAATSQKPRAVLDAITDFYETANANPHRGAYALSVEATDRYHAARERVAKFTGLSDPDCLIF